MTNNEIEKLINGLDTLFETINAIKQRTITETNCTEEQANQFAMQIILQGKN